VVSTGNVAKQVDSPIFDRWQNQYVVNQAAQLYDHHIQARNNRANYISDIFYQPNYKQINHLEPKESVKAYCYLENPDLNKLMADAANLYGQLYPTEYNNLLNL